MHYISFCSEGEPNDRGLDLSESRKILGESLDKTDMKYFFYTPKFMRESGYGEFVKEHENAGLVSMNPNMNLVGFCAWKPLIMLLELEKMKDGDILVYRDCNCKKYNVFNDFTNFENTIRNILKKAKFDFFIPQDEPDVNLGKHCKSNIIDDLAINKEFTRQFPLLIANIIICRKSKIVIEILEEWKKYCLVDEYINGEQYGDLYKEFRWFTPEQSILTVIISNYVFEGKHNIPKTYPNIIFKNRDINNQIIVDERKIVESFTNSMSYDYRQFNFLTFIVVTLFIVFLNYKKIYLNAKKLLVFKKNKCKVQVI